MKTIVGFIELKHNGKFKLVLNLNFNKLGFIDGSRIPAGLSHTKELIAGLSMVGLDNIKLDINSRVLEGLALKLSSYQISSSLAKCSNLIELSFV